MSDKQQFNILNLSDVETERSLLRALMEFDTDETVMSLVKLKEEHFFDEGHQRIFTVLRELDDRGIKLDIQIVKTELSRSDPKSIDALRLIALSEPMAAQMRAVDALDEWARKRALHRAYIEGLNAIHSGESSRMSGNDVAKQIDDATLTTVDDFKTYSELEKEYETLPPLAKIPTGIPFLDSKLKGGLEAGKFVLLFGDPEAGKTALGAHILRNVSNNFKTIFFPFEFSSRDFIEKNAVNKGKFNPDNFIIDDDSTDIHDLAAKLKIFAKQGGQLALIDSQMMVTNLKNRGTSEEKETEKFTILARICIRYSIRIIFICQQGKEDTRSGTVTPMKSKNGAHSAHIIIYVEKPKFERDENGDDINKGKREVVFFKNKQTGVFGSKPVKIDPRTLEFSGRQFDEDDHRSNKTTGSGRPKRNSEPEEVVYEMEDEHGNISAMEDPNLFPSDSIDMPGV